jgi:putative ABC transport system permease protein
LKTRKLVGMAWTNLKQRRLRTSLTTLGVIIGITAIIGIASLGEGFRLEIRQRMQAGFELDNLTVIPGSLFAGLSPNRFADTDIQNISQISGVKIATGVMQLGNVTLYNGNKTVQAFVATAVNFTEFIQIFPDRFVFENVSSPLNYNNDTLIIGHKVNHPNDNDTTPFAVPSDNVTLTLGILVMYPIPHSELQNYTFTIGGTLQKTGTPGITNFDYWIFLPLEKAREIYRQNGILTSQESDLIFVKILDPEQSETIAKGIEALFPPFRVTILVPLTFIRQVDNVLTIVQIFLMAIASISLLVAGIGIMNIMTVTVMERTREIGILKAIGANSRTVLTMFLAEAILIGVMGGVIGLFTGYGLSYGLAFMLSSLIQPQQNPTFQTPETQKLTISPVFSPEWTIAAFVFAVVICVVFGLYPARKASKLNPVEALRYE